MSWLDSSIEANEAASQDQRLERTSEKLKPTFFQGGYDALGQGLVRGVIEGGAAAKSAYLNAALTGGPEQNIFDYTQSTTLSPEAQTDINTDLATTREETAQAVSLLRPDPNEVGTAGQIIGEAAAILPRTILASAVAGPLAGAAAAGAPAGYSRRAVSMSEGIDEGTANLLGITEGVTTAAGAALPAAGFVKPLLGDAAATVAANVGLGVAHRAASAEILESHGYTAQAAQYRALDGTAVATDVIMGLAFFGIGRAGMRKPTTEQVDAALTERNAQHADIDTAPGAPIDPKSSVAHQDALRSAIESINRGEQVVLPDSINNAQFLRATDEPAPITITRDDALASAREELAPVIRAEAEEAAAGALPNVKDVKAELANLSKSLDGLDQTFRDRAKEFQQQGMGRKKAEQAARAAVDAERTTLTGRQTELNQSLDGNRSAEQARAELNALDRGEIPARFDERLNAKADDIAQGFQRKPLADGVSEANRTLTPRQINERAAREEIDTLVREHEATLPREPAVKKATEQELAATKGATRATDSAKPATAAPKSDSPPGGKTTAPADGEGKATANPEPPELQMLRDAVSRNPEAVVNSGYDADGVAVKEKASDVLAAIEAEHATGVKESQSYVAAITCMLRGA